MIKKKATFKHWLSEKTSKELDEQSKKLLHAKDVRHVRLMADAHLANDVCVGCVLATKTLLYPAAVGGDIGCGMLAAEVDLNSDDIDASTAENIFAHLKTNVPIQAQRKPHFVDSIGKLSSDKLRQVAQRSGGLQLGTLGRGNHFLELQRCHTSNQVWIMIHTGSRCMGPAIRDFYLTHAEGQSKGLGYLDSETERGESYLNDMQWARRYAERNRLLILEQCQQLFQKFFSTTIDTAQMIHCDHNHLERISIGREQHWVHRKGACSVKGGEYAVIPGSMGSDSFHVKGKGNADSLYSSSHGAGRQMSRKMASRSITTNHLKEQLKSTFYQPEKLAKLTEEAPSSYKNIDNVMAQQRKLVTAVRRLSPILSYKGV
ncbi:RtcB family protein [Alteromonadaceae bacterium M269]|nr:RtcB family protein [Alteromonadaceae bacterium M269]